MNEKITKEELIDQLKGNKVLKAVVTFIGVLVVIVLAVLGYKNLISGPKEIDSQVATAKGIMLMENDSITAAIDELSYVSDEYSGYGGAHIANYAVGNMLFEQGRYDEALEALLKVELDDTYLMTLTLGTIGDAYSELGDFENAVKNYLKAAKRVENDLTTPTFYFKAGLNAEEMGDYVAAKEYYSTIKQQYLSFANQKSIDKYITRVEGRM